MRKGYKRSASLLLSLRLILDKKKPLADLQQGALYNSVMDHMLFSVLARRHEIFKQTEYLMLACLSDPG